MTNDTTQEVREAMERAEAACAAAKPEKYDGVVRYDTHLAESDPRLLLSYIAQLEAKPAPTTCGPLCGEKCPYLLASDEEDIEDMCLSHNQPLEYDHHTRGTPHALRIMRQAHAVARGGFVRGRTARRHPVPWRQDRTCTFLWWRGEGGSRACSTRLPSSRGVSGACPHPGRSAWRSPCCESGAGRTICATAGRKQLI